MTVATASRNRYPLVLLTAFLSRSPSAILRGPRSGSRDCAVVATPCRTGFFRPGGINP